MPNVMKTIGCAVNRVTRHEVALDQKQAVSVMDVLKGVTLNAAYQYGEERDKGSLKKGKRQTLLFWRES